MLIEWTEKFSEAFRSAKATDAKQILKYLDQNTFLYKYSYCYLKKSNDFFWGGPTLTKKIQLQGESDVFAFVFMNTQNERHRVNIELEVYTSCLFNV